VVLIRLHTDGKHEQSQYHENQTEHRPAGEIIFGTDRTPKRAPPPVDHQHAQPIKRGTLPGNQMVLEVMHQRLRLGIPMSHLPADGRL